MEDNNTLIPALLVEPGPNGLLRPDRHPVAVYLGRLAPGSVRAMASGLHTVANLLSSGRHSALTLPWQDLRYPHLQALRVALIRKYAPASTNRILTAVRMVLKECWRLGLMDAEDYQRAVDVAGVRSSRTQPGRALKTRELIALLRACVDDPSPAGARDGAMIAVLYSGGLRRAEIVALDVTDYESDGSALTVRAGKGNKDRVCYVEASGPFLEAWLRVRGVIAGPLFCPAKDGRITIRRMTPNAVRAMLIRRAAEAGVAHFSPHDLRRTFVSDLLDAGADVSAVQQLAGHANVATTLKYDRRPEEAKRRAARRLTLPDLSS